MKNKAPFLLLAIIPIGAALFLIADRAEQTPAMRDNSVSITQKHAFSAVAGTAVARMEGANPYGSRPKPDGKLHIGESAPGLRFTALDGKSYTLADWRGKLPLIMMADTTCPCVRAYDKRMKALVQQFPDLRVAYVFPSPLESRGEIAKFAASRGYAWPVAFDGEQKVMATLGGRCTTESFLFDRDGKLRYHGRIDDNIYDEANVHTRDLQYAIQSLIGGKTIVKSEAPAYGCVIPQRSKNGTFKTGKGKST
jgi:peroxiredoxin